MSSGALSYPLFDADNHLYENRDALTKFLPREYEGLVKYVDINGRTKLAIRDHITGKRRAMLRFFACTEDLSHEEPDAPLPDAVASGEEPFFIIAAIAGG